MDNQNNSELLRFTTAGSVDDGKSTLIGRLLYDSKSIFQDQYEAIEKVSERRGEEDVNLALLTDGLKSERELSPLYYKFLISLYVSIRWT